MASEFVKFLNPKSWKRPKGYSNVVSARGRMVFVAGQIGWTGDEIFETDDFAGQVRQALENIKACLETADARPEHIVRLTWYATDKREYLGTLPEIGAAYRDVFGKCFPAMALLEVADLVENRAKIEIEATAIVPEN
ncbi:MAG: RidA family protein [Hyphomicrobiales bacterium]